MKTNIKQPVGLQPVVDAVRDIVVHAEAYRSGVIRPAHMIVTLDPGNGQSTLTRYIAESFAAHGVQPFSDLDLYLEFRAEDSEEQLQGLLTQRRMAAVYTNAYDGVTAVDLSRLAADADEDYVAGFLQALAEDNADTLVLYVPSVMSRSVRNLVNRIRTVLDGAVLYQVAPYTAQELAEILKGMLADSGIEVQADEALDCALADMVEQEHIGNLKQAKQLYRRLVLLANRSGFVPVLGAEELKKGVK